ncbi:unnamed protein product [Rangifer tarandus platyrhynchus]|uniref:Uncharacterized protein n=2 Tax=Rangifer tarandus platyrhynchus TaxID=3082113 RepID=A0ACB0DZN9_RANTA|nr:unnamed protein product [Rangifer tarandus platyrhynchus]CAI9693805.1 unnamed protein product [Rangifer tarandus platyrhynchus]
MTPNSPRRVTTSAAGASRRHVCAAREGGGAALPRPQPAPSVAPPPGPRTPLFVVNGTRLVVANRRAGRRVG